MTLLPLFDLRSVLLIAGVVVAFSLAALSFVWHGLLSAREQVARRVDSLASVLGGRLAAKKEPAETADRVFRLPQGGVPTSEVLELARRLRRYGIPETRAPSLYLALRLGLGIVLVPLMLAVVARFGAFSSLLQPLVIVVLGIGGGWFAPAVVLDTLSRRRVKEIERALPEAMELLIIVVEAGLALEDGIDRIVVELQRSRPLLAEELALTAADLKILPDREMALKNFARRVDVPSVRSVTATLAHTMRFGTPLAQALRVVASELRNEALARLEERANRMPVLLTIPMVVFILPAVFILIGGPAFLKVMDVILR